MVAEGPVWRCWGVVYNACACRVPEQSAQKLASCQLMRTELSYLLEVTFGQLNLSASFLDTKEN